MYRICALLIGAVAFGPSLATAAEITAFVEPYQDIDVASPEMGTLRLIQVKEGDQVTQGQVLAVLDDNVVRAALKMAQTAKDARGRLESAMAELRLRSSRLRKVAGLLRRQHASEEEVLRAKSQVEIAEAQVQAVHDELEVKLADYHRIVAQLERKRIKSPINGVVTQVLKDPGEFVSASEPVIAKVVQLDPLLAEFSVPAKQSKKLQVDQPIAVDVGEDRQEIEGVIEFVSPTSDAQSGTARVKVRIPNADGKIQSGEACWLQITPSSDEQLSSI